MATQLFTRNHSDALGHFAGAIALSIVLGTTSLAQSSDLSDDENFIDFYGGQESEALWEIRTGFLSRDEGDLNKTTGDLSINRAFYELRYRWPDEERANFSIGFEEEHSNYDFDGAVALGITTPFRTVKRSSLSTNYHFKDEDGSWILNGALTLGREKGVSPSEGLYGEATMDKLWKMSDSVEFGIGLYTYSKLEDSAEFVPFPIFNWQMSKSVRLGLVENRFPGYGLRFQLSKRWDAYLIGSYEVRQYRLKDRTGLSNASAVDEELNARGGFLWANNSTSFEIFGGLSRHEISTESGNSLAGRDVSDAAPFVGANFSVQL